MMGKRKDLVAVGIALILSGCGGGGSGGGGGVAGTPTPPPAPPSPAPTNTSIANLVASQTFAADAGNSAVTIDTNVRTTSAGSAGRQTLTVAYDASAKSYTVTTPGRATTYLPSDIQGTDDGETRYFRTDGPSRNYLTLVTTPYSGNTPNKYVALGFQQRNELNGGQQATSFDAFTFGFETSTAAVPRTGSASWKTDVFGLYTAPNQTPRTLQGAGDFTVNFAKALFSTSTYVTQYDFLTGASLSGGGIEVVAKGTLGSGNSFTGNLAYAGSLGTVAGSINGRFYGPDASEIGAAFYADNAAGATLSGGLTGQKAATTTPIGFTLDSITSDQLFYSIWATLNQSTSSFGTGFFAQSPTYAQTFIRPDGSFRIGTPSSDLPTVEFTATDRLAAGRADFASYQKTVDGRAIRVDLYRPDAGSQAIVLTYAGFGIWGGALPNGINTRLTNGYFSYGFTTPRDILSRRTGTGSYAGIAYGTAGAANGDRYNVGGASQFDVDFTSQRFSGSLALTVAPEAGGASMALGTWQFAAAMQYGLPVMTALTNGTPGNPLNVITPQFFGPSGQEIVAPFSIATGATVSGQYVSVAGVTVAKVK